MPYSDPAKQRQAQAEYAARRRRKEPERVKELHRQASSKIRIRNRAIIAEFKAAGCVYCSEADPIAIDCHHRAGETKEFEIGKWTTSDVSEDRLRAELAKCEPVCANCHRKLHAGRDLALGLNRS